MCNFFQRVGRNEKRMIKMYAFEWIFVPFIMGCYYTFKQDTYNANLTFMLAAGVFIGTINGYVIGRFNECKLPHLPENIQLEREPGEPSQLRIA